MMTSEQAMAQLENSLQAAEVGLEYVKDAQVRECLESLCEAMRALEYRIDAQERAARDDY